MGLAAASSTVQRIPGLIAFPATVCTILPKYAHVHIAAASCPLTGMPNGDRYGSHQEFAMGVRRRDMPPEDFHDYWRHPHGTWGRRMSTLRGYVQSHQIHTEHLGPGQAEYECVAELWWTMKGMCRDLSKTRAEYAKYLHDDGPNFCDLSRANFATREEVLTSDPLPARCSVPGMICGRPTPGRFPSATAFRRRGCRSDGRRRRMRRWA